ncbi:MAG: DUF502 domain-containing protein [Bacteroidia bacterium]|nr:DUF502 domain-containing protein [Bacteroidia bacterium]
MDNFENELRRKRIFNKIVNYFLRGMLISIPLAATIGIIYWLFMKIDSILGEDHFPGLGILIIFSGVTLIGVLGSSYITQPLFGWFNEWLEKTPGIKFLYSSVKDIMEAFVGEKKKFSEPVLVSLSGEDIYKIGFLTRKDLHKMGLPGYSGVYFPKSYGFMGDLYLVKNEKIKPLNMNSTEVFKLIVSGGLTDFESPNV